jgi:hypothetical protein
MIIAGEKLDYRVFIDDSKFEEVKKIAQNSSNISLKDVKSNLSFNIGFAELRVLFAIAQSEL